MVMAIGMLRQDAHTFRHDLESFFYLLLWLCAEQAWSNGFAEAQERRTSFPLRQWEAGDMEQTANLKTDQMFVNGVRRILDTFPRSVSAIKELCMELRVILFGNTAELGLETPAETDILYVPIVKAFEKALRQFPPTPLARE